LNDARFDTVEIKSDPTAPSETMLISSSDLESVKGDILPCQMTRIDKMIIPIKRGRECGLSLKCIIHHR